MSRDEWKNQTFHEYYGFSSPPPSETVYDVGQSEESEQTFSSVEEWKSWVLERAREEWREKGWSVEVQGDESDPDCVIILPKKETEEHE